MKYYYDEEREEVIRPRKAVPKEKKPKADHKHDYVLLNKSDIHRMFDTYSCVFCGREK